MNNIDRILNEEEPQQFKDADRFASHVLNGYAMYYQAILGGEITLSEAYQGLSELLEAESNMGKDQDSLWNELKTRHQR